MKKALIITYYKSDNYGAFLQAFAMQEFLCSYGIQASILDYDSKSAKFLNGILNLLKRENKPEDRIAFEYHKKMADAVISAQQALKLTNRKDGYDVTVLGSDEIWNVKNLGAAHDPMLFCKNKGSKRTISYAACAGNSSKSFLRVFPYAIPGIRHLDAVGVRDDNTERLVKGIGRQDVIRVLDPTFLVDFNSYLPRRILNEDYLFVYSYGLSDSQIKQIQNLADMKHLKIVATGCYCSWADYNPAPTPFEWIQYIKDANFVITSTFHGTVFSIQNRKSFAVFNSNSPKIKSILRELCLLDRRVTEWNSLEELFDNGVQYEKISKMISDGIETSKEFLLKHFEIASNNGNQRTKTNCDVICYIARHKDEKIRWNSRSGGAFTAISDLILERKGVVYGAAVNADFSVSHIRATSKNERDKQRGSKYVQSDIIECLSTIKQDLMENRVVLFSGTSCQVDAVKKIAKAIKKEEYLLTLDFICHGVPSPKVWKDYVGTYENVTEVDFRNKKVFGWGDHRESIVSNQKRIDKHIFSSLYNKELISRPSCYECPYATYNRCSDITIADCWGLEKLAPGFNTDDSGASMMFASSTRGKTILKDALGSMDFIESCLALMKQPVIESQGMGAFLPPPSREQFWSDYEKYGISFVCAKYLKTSKLDSLKEFVRLPHSVRFFIKKLLRRN